MRLPGAMLATALLALAIPHAGAAEELKAVRGAESASAARSGMLESKPGRYTQSGNFKAGLQWLEIAAKRNPALFVPTSAVAGQSNPLVILLHGAGGEAANTLPLMQGLAEERGFLLLVPQSAGATWDVIQGGYGPDVAMLDRALDEVFRNHQVDPKRVAVAGFSDGGSYALSIGLSNGALFSDVLAFSPGFMAPAKIVGQPRIFISHGTRDEVLPIDRCSRRLVQQLAKAGYDTDYREFDGGHVVPPDMVAGALDRFLAR